MNKNQQDIFEFVENVNLEYHDKTNDDDLVPISFTTTGSFDMVELHMDKILFCEDFSIEEGIKNLDIFIKKTKAIKRAITKVYSKLTVDQLESLGICEN